MSYIAPTGGGGNTGGGATGLGHTGPVASSNGHHALMWFLAAVLVIALAGPFPGAMTMLMLILILLVLLKNYQTYFSFLGVH